MTYDVGDYGASLDKALEVIDYAGFGSASAKARPNGKLRGIGFSCYIEACGIAPSKAVGSLGAGVGLWESAEVRVNPVGTVEVLTGSHSHGQGHETTFAQLVAGRLGIPIEQVSIVHGDTDKVQIGMGTYGSRSAAVGMSAIFKAIDKVERQGQEDRGASAGGGRGRHRLRERRVHGHRHRQVDRAADGRAAGLCRAQVRRTGSEPGLKEGAFYDPTNFTFPAGVHICEIEIDPDTGKTQLRQRSAAVDDFGTLINPMIVEGQVHGGIAQGIGQALLEGAVYDSDRPARDRELHGLLHAARRRSAVLQAVA